MPEFSRQVISLFQKRAAAEPGGLLSGKDPTEVNFDEPIRLWIIQLGIIICTASLLSLALRKLRQPKVIAEVLGGIILGPTAFGTNARRNTRFTLGLVSDGASLGRIPGFTEHIFPEDSRSHLALTANIGLCLFLFLVGLEIDAGIIKRNARLSAMVALAGMVIPFGIGAGLSVPIYKKFIDPSVEFTHFMLFAGVAFSITAFPVLCRILTELKLLDTTVGIVVLSAGVGNDIIGWVLLALSVALVNAGSGLTALYILLVSVGWTLFILFPVKYAMKWLGKVTGSIESGPSVLFMTVTIIVLFGSAFFTDVIGVHAIFGAFLAGLVVPREGGLAITLTEKLEDMVAIIFLPLYFTLSGLSTDLGLLNDGITWGYTLAIVFTAFIGKFGGCSLAARYAARFSWRESLTIGSLMSCKGLVELIVLNVGLSAGILSRRVFSMFVLEALVLTFATTPLVEWLYPARYRVRISGAGHHKGGHGGEEGPEEKGEHGKDGSSLSRFTVVLDKFEHLGPLMALVQLISPIHHNKTKKRQPGSHHAPHIEALRVIELSDRTSARMKSSAAEAVLQSDPLLSTFRMYGVLNNISTSASLAVVKFEEMGHTIAEHARHHSSDMIFIPWLPPNSQIPGPGVPNRPSSPVGTPMTEKKTALGQDLPSSVIHSQFVRSIFSQATRDVALFVDQSMTNTEVTPGFAGQHLFLPFLGGPDDRLALEFVVQVCERNPTLTATVLRIVKTEKAVEGEKEGAVQNEAVNMLTISSEIPGHFPDTFYGTHNTQIQLQSDTADNIAWANYAQNVYGGTASNETPATKHNNHSGASLSRQSSSSQRNQPQIEWKEVTTHALLHAALQEALQLQAGISATSRHYHELSHKNDRGDVNQGEDTKEEIDIVEEERPELDAGAEDATAQGTTGRRKRGPLIVVAGRSRRMAVENHRAELVELMDQYGPIGAEVRRTVGDVASAFSIAGIAAGVVVLQAGSESERA